MCSYIGINVGYGGEEALTNTKGPRTRLRASHCFLIVSHDTQNGYPMGTCSV
jgi:hypothetical protein